MAGSSILTSSVSSENEILAGSHSITVSNFPTLSEEFTSSVFSVGPNKDVELKFHLSAIKLQGRVWYYVYVTTEDVKIELPIITLKHGFCLLSAQKVKGSTWTHQVNNIFLKKDIPFNISIISRDWIMDNSKYFLQNNELTVVYEMAIYRSTSNTSVTKIPADFQVLFESQKDSDVKLLVDSQEFTAHKLILSTRSPVFSAMFQTEMKESQENQVKISDIDAETFKELLRFIYTDEVENLEQNAYELFRAAHKYDLPWLKVICEKQLYKNLGVENCVAIFMVADVYHCKTLKQCALKFIVDNAVTVMDSKEYELMARSHPELILEAFKALAIKSNVK